MLGRSFRIKVPKLISMNYENSLLQYYYCTEYILPLPSSSIPSSHPCITSPSLEKPPVSHVESDS
jgi:hypothetical protein